MTESQKSVSVAVIVSRIMLGSALVIVKLPLYIAVPATVTAPGKVTARVEVSPVSTPPRFK